MDAFDKRAETNEEDAVASSRIFRSVFLLTLCIFAPSEGSAQQIPQLTADAARLPQWYRSVAKIFVRCDSDADGKQELYTGAGTVVRNDGIVLTAAHVGSACMNVASTVRIGLMTATDREPADLFRATLMRRVADGNAAPTADQVNDSLFQDLTLYQINVDASTNPRPVFPAATIAQANPLPGEHITVAGYSNFPFKGMRPPEVAGLPVLTPSIISTAQEHPRRA